MKIREQHQCFGGKVLLIEHEAETMQCAMRFSIFLPSKAVTEHCPTVVYLSGLTCTEENFTTKAHAYQTAERLGLIIVAPDTSPRGEGVADDSAYDLGQGAGFYINATEAPWDTHFQMRQYVAEELLDIITEHYPVKANKIGIMGHSMGGHGALTLHLHYPDIFKSVSAFAPICAPMQCPWGQKAFTAYLGKDQEKWQDYDATALMEVTVKSWQNRDRMPLLIDQGLDDQFLDEQLKPQLFEAACKQVNHPLTLRYHKGYDHSYFFIQTFIADHLEHHLDCLSQY